MTAVVLAVVLVVAVTGLAYIVRELHRLPQQIKPLPSRPAPGQEPTQRRHALDHAHTGSLSAGAVRAMLEAGKLDVDQLRRPPRGGLPDD